ncbi:MAG TPA: hypothetical protein VML96_01610 [Egibacteraceae bacterium]|nr:hypothetical protein [Egibacteraceae bacterium]
MAERLAIRRDGGYLTVQFLFAVALSLILLTAMANLIVFQYGRGVVRAALDEGVRAGSRVNIDAASHCEARVRSALSDLLGGRMGADVAFLGCAEDGRQVQARADVAFRGWLPMVPDWAFSLGATAVKEREPDAD